MIQNLNLRTILVPGLAVLFLFQGALTQEPDSITVQEAVEIALLSHPGLSSSRERLNEFQAQKREALAAAFPTVDATVSSVRSRNPGLLNSPNFDDFAAGLPIEFLVPVPVTSYDYGISVEQTLYAFGKVSKAVQAARLQEEQLMLEIRDQELALARDVALACYELARATTRIGVLASERDSREAQVQQASDFMEIGTGTRLQYLQARTALASLRSREIAARGQREIAAFELNELLGRDTLTEVVIDPTLLSGTALQDPPSRTVLNTASSTRVDLQALAKEREVLEKLRKIQQTDLLPDLRFNGMYGFQAIDVSNLTDTNFENWHAGVYLEWTLYDGGATQARTRQIDSQRSQSLYRTEERKGEIAKDLYSNLARYRLAREAVQAAREAVTEAEESLRVSTESRAWGAATALDLLEAERSLTEVRFQELDAVFTALAAQAEIKNLVGRMPYETLSGDMRK
jgi:outer membrane protein TolC